MKTRSILCILGSAMAIAACAGRSTVSTGDIDPVEPTETAAPHEFSIEDVNPVAVNATPTASQLNSQAGPVVARARHEAGCPPSARTELAGWTCLDRFVERAHRNSRNAESRYDRDGQLARLCSTDRLGCGTSRSRHPDWNSGGVHYLGQWSMNHIIDAPIVAIPIELTATQ